jgi:hypothetical protein
MTEDINQMDDDEEDEFLGFGRITVGPEIQAKMPAGRKIFTQLNMFETAWLEFKRFWGIK